MRPGEAHDATGVEIEILGDSGLSPFGYFGDLEVGAWEMPPGVVEDIEFDEVFVVLAGRGTVEFLEPALPAITLTPGTVVRLAEGMRTRWTVTETVRKVYLSR